MEIIKVRHLWPEPAGFFINRPMGTPEYVLLHFLNSVEFETDGKKTVTEPGALVVMPPEKPYRFGSPGELVHDWIHITGDVDKVMGKFGLEPARIYNPACGELISEITESLELELYAGRLYFRELGELKLTELFLHAARSAASPEVRFGVGIDTVKRLKEVRSDIMAHPEKEWPIKIIAETVGLSESRLYAVYREVFGISPNRDIISLRTEKARFLLMQGHSVSQVAEETGYASVNHFIRQFKNETGRTPREFAVSWGIGEFEKKT